MTDTLKAPFPWFGGKSRAAEIVWSRFGDVPNYVEPFFGSGAVLLGRPTEPHTETVNDLDCYLANFWRALRADPDAVAAEADWPVNEADILARHRWLLDQAEFRQRIRTDAEYYHARIAGWWVWGQCAWIGSGWCRQESTQLPHLGDAGRGINRKLPHLGNAGRGINRKLPHLGNAGRGAQIQVYFQELSERLRDVRVACGEWDRVLGDSVTFRHGLTGVFLDPPYTDGDMQYSAGGCGGGVADAVREWAIANGDNSLLRIALCGYEGEHDMPESWGCVPWKAQGGYSSDGTNSARERIYFSPACLKVERAQLDIFDFMENE